MRVPLPTGTWLAKHSLSRREGLDGECYTLESKGDYDHEGLICIEMHSDPLRLGDGRSLLVGGIYLPKDRQLREVLRIPLGTGPMDDERCVMKKPCAQYFYVKLNPQIHDGGSRLVVVDDLEHPCAMTDARLSRIRDMGPKFLQQQQRLDTIACSARGEYLWENGRYVKRSKLGVKARNTSGP